MQRWDNRTVARSPCYLRLDDCRIARSRVPPGVQGRWQAVGCRSERRRSYPINRPLSTPGFPPAFQAVFNKLGLNHSLALSEG